MNNIPVGKSLEAQDVFVDGRLITTNSLRFAKRFGVEHMELLRKIRKLTMENSLVENEFVESTFLNSRGRTYPYYEITKKGFMLLAMNAGTPKSEEVRQRYYQVQNDIADGFLEMEKKLLNQSNLEWKKSREQGKLVRKVETDALKDLLEYIKATEPDSTYIKRPSLCYSNYTKMTYKCLDFLQNNKPKTRELLDMFELNQLVLAEKLVEKVIHEGIKEKEHYKVIYQNCKVALENFSNSLFLLK